MLNGLLFVPESQRRAFWSKCLLPAFPFLFFFFFWCLKCQQMRNNLYHLVSVVISNGWKGHNTADHTGEQWTPHTSPLKPLHLFTCIDWAKEGGGGEKVSGILHEQFRVHSHALRDFILGELRAWWRLRQQDQIQSHLDRTNEGEMPSLDRE